MALVNTPGSAMMFVGPNALLATSVMGNTGPVIDAANEAVFFIGHCETADGGSHTIDTSGSSSIAFRTGVVTFANGGTVFALGIAAVDTTSAVTVARPIAVADVVTFDVAAVLTGGGLTTTAWNTIVPTTGTKTIANGDLICIGFQMTARGGADSIIISASIQDIAAQHTPVVTQFAGGSYVTSVGQVGAVITFSDGTLGWIYGSEIYTTRTTLIFDSADAINEYGQLYNLPFPCKIIGLYSWGDIDNDAECVLYSDPLGTPVPEKTVVIDASVRSVGSQRRFLSLFPSPYTYAAGTNIAAILKPTTTSAISTQSKTLASATHRVTDVWGASGYGVKRGGGTGAFANINSSLDHVMVGLLVGAFDDGVSAGGGLMRHPAMSGGLNA